ncbi:MAG: 16S rRNA (cytosine(1402)-N(4))-methyltransferase RsmH [Oscillospiraceae bacterium]|nr:16S rRNA (cytosine(1402)-N(4))-methyltransferase RsmH [Oscillospiraceae bacterium]
MNHVTVLLHEAVDGLNVRTDGLYYDGTLGFGGHSEEILKRGGRLIAADRDRVAIDASRERLAQYGDRVTFVQANFGDITQTLKTLGVEKLDGVLCDFGVSSPQLDVAERGFSYMASAPLDMRMNADDTLTAYDVVNKWSEAEIKRILYEYGEERYAPRIAWEITKRRANRPLETTDELVDAIRAAMLGKALREKQHPAKRTFQAVRMAVNNEIAEIMSLLDALPDVLNTGGRASLITFHSGEDAPVKAKLRSFADGCTCPPGFPKCVCGFVPTMRVITKKPIVPSDEEIEQNPRARSAKLRIAERI